MKYRKLSELKKLPKNPRIINDDQFRKLCDSIKKNQKFFEARPLILSNRTGKLVIIAGNQRYEAARFLQFKKVPTFLIEGLTKEQEKEIVIRDNVSNGNFDWEELECNWKSYPLEEWGVESLAPKKEEPEEEKEETEKEKANNKCPECGHEW